MDLWLNGLYFVNSRSYTFEKSRIRVVFGDITTSTSQVIVSSDDYYITMGGGVSGAILQAGGQEIIIDAAKKVPAKLGDVVVTTAGRLKAQYLFHAITIEQYSTEVKAAAIVRQCVARCFDLLDALGLHSIAFPAIGAGVARFSYEDVAVEMAAVMAERLSHSNRAIEATLYLFDRFGRMQPIDFIQFFEEFARRTPQLRPAQGEMENVVEQVPTPTPAPAGSIAQQQQARARLNSLTDERAALEERLAVRKGVTADEKQLRARLETIAAERIEVLSSLQQEKSGSVSVFISYSHKDQLLREELEKHLAILKRLAAITTWHDRKIAAGDEWRGVIDENLKCAGIILLLVSPDFMASDYCFDVEVEFAMKQHEAGKARVVPVILRSVMWDQAPFAKLQALPTDAKPINEWPDRDTAFVSVARGIRSVVQSITAHAVAQNV